MDAGILLLRVGAGLSLLLLFGVQKVHAAAAFTFAGEPWQFVDFNRRVGLPLPVVVAYFQTFNESLGALAVAAGFFTRIAALLLAAGFAAATFCSLKMKEEAWLTAAYFCLMFASLALIGGGRFSIDRFLHARIQR